jgi:hypothetical protein
MEETRGDTNSRHERNRFRGMVIVISTSVTYLVSTYLVNIYIYVGGKEEGKKENAQQLKEKNKKKKKKKKKIKKKEEREDEPGGGHALRIPSCPVIY